MRLIDTHCHLDFPDFDEDRDAVIERAREAGVIRIVNVGSGLENCQKTIKLAKEYDFIYAAVGVHPHYADSFADGQIGLLRAMAAGDRVVAIGEVGLDYYRDLSGRDEQRSAFIEFIRLSRELNLPLIIHSRDAAREVLDILKKEFPRGWKGVMHCFSGSLEDAGLAVDMGFYISFACNLTFRNAHASRRIARHIPLVKLLLETDAPFLPPQKFRGRRNEPARLPYLVKALSQIKGVPEEKVAEVTSDNADKLFGLRI